MEITGVVSVQEVLTGQNNLLIEILSPEASNLTGMTKRIEELSINVKEAEILGPSHSQPFNHFGQNVATD